MGRGGTRPTQDDLMSFPFVSGDGANGRLFFPLFLPIDSPLISTFSLSGGLGV